MVAYIFNAAILPYRVDYTPKTIEYRVKSMVKKTHVELLDGHEKYS